MYARQAFNYTIHISYWGGGGKLVSRIVLALSFEHGPSLDGAWGGLPLSGMPLAQAAEDLGTLKVLPS